MDPEDVLCTECKHPWLSHDKSQRDACITSAFRGEAGNLSVPREFAVVNVETNKIVSWWDRRVDAMIEAEKNPRRWLVVHESNLASLGIAP